MIEIKRQFNNQIVFINFTFKDLYWLFKK